MSEVDVVKMSRALGISEVDVRRVLTPPSERDGVMAELADDGISLDRAWDIYEAALDETNSGVIVKANEVINRLYLRELEDANGLEKLTRIFYDAPSDGQAEHTAAVKISAFFMSE